ncbi:MAG: YceI family protein [Acidimicrobiales bacterium]|nr:YceI family protein [Acidimicrobiales bacterium]
MARARFELAPDRSQVWIEGSSSIHPIHATATGLGGWVALELARGAVAAKPKVAGEVRIEVGRLRSGNPLVDAETRRRIDAGTHPEIVGSVIGSTRLASDRVALTGDLTFRGQTHEVEGELTLAIVEDGVHLTGTQQFDVRTWGLQPPKIGLLRVHPTVRVRIEAFAVSA